MSNYTLDVLAAKMANAGGRIDTTGKYIGKIKHAIMFTNGNGTDAVEFEFVDSSGSAATLTLWTRSSKNPKLSGYNVLMSMMTVCSIKGLNGTNRTVKKYDYDEKAVIDKVVCVAPEFDDKDIGLLLQREEYEKNNGDIGYRMNIFAAFQAQTGLTATEIIDRQTVSSEILKIESRLADKKAKVSSTSAQSSTVNVNSTQGLDDDLPF